MRIFKLHFLGAKKLAAKLNAAKEAGRDENRRLVARVMSKLLEENTKMRAELRGRRRK